MRTLGFRTHVLLALVGASGILLALSRLWYAPAQHVPDEAEDIGDINGPLNGFFGGLKRWATGSDGVSGWHSLGNIGVALAAMAGLAALGALLCMVPALQSLGRDLLRYGALAAFAITAWKLFDPPGDNAVVELRSGALAAAGFSIMLLTAGMGAAKAPLRKRRPDAPKYQAPPPPAYGTTSSAPPPGA
jgi:hypothetical protein